MTTISPISSTLSAVSPAANTFLTDKINVLFALTAAGAAYCLYNFYQAYQFHTSFGLSEKAKLIKCEALLLQAAEKQSQEDAHPLIQQCEALLDSIIIDRPIYNPGDAVVHCPHIFAKDRLLAKLAQYYAETFPDHACFIAEQLISWDNIFDVAQSIQKNHPNFIKLVSLYQLADKAREKEAISLALTRSSITMGDINWSLKLTEIYYSQRSYLVAHGHAKKAQTLALTLENPMDKMNALCCVAKCKFQTLTDESIAAAKELIPNMPIEDLVQARLILADVYVQNKNLIGINQELDAVIKLLQEEPSTHKDLVTYLRFIEKNKEHYISSVKVSLVQDLINKVLNYTSTLVGKNKMEAFLNLSSLYLEELVEYPESKAELRTEVAVLIGKMPENSEAEKSSKIDSWCRLIYFYKQDPDGAQSIFIELERLADSPQNWSQAQKIIAVYEQMGQAYFAELFFQGHLFALVNQKDKDASSKITELSMTGFPRIYSEQQYKAKLNAAEKLLPQLSNREWNAAQAEIAQGYLPVDPQKSLAMLTDLETRQRDICLITAVATGVGLAALRFCPLASPVIFLGVGAYTWHTW